MCIRDSLGTVFLAPRDADGGLGNLGPQTSGGGDRLLHVELLSSGHAVRARLRNDAVDEILIAAKRLVDVGLRLARRLSGRRLARFGDAGLAEVRELVI